MSPMPPAITSGNSPAPASKRASHQPALLLSNRTDSAPLMPCAVAFDYLAQTQSRQIRDEAWAKRREPLARSQSLKAPAFPLTLSALRREPRRRPASHPERALPARATQRRPPRTIRPRTPPGVHLGGNLPRGTLPAAPLGVHWQPSRWSARQRAAVTSPRWIRRRSRRRARP